MNRRTLSLVALLVVAIAVLWWVRDQREVALTPLEAGADAHLDIEYGAHERNTLDVYTPEGDGPHPTIVWLHPGGWVSGDKAASMPVWDWTDRGYAVVSVNYRYAIAPDTVAGSVDDGLAAVRHVLANHAEWDLDPSRLGVYGFSAGGHLAAMIAHEKLPVAAIAVAGSPTDFGPLLDPAVEFFDGNRGPEVVTAAQNLLGCSAAPLECDGQATAVSPAQLAPGDVDLLIVHGAIDHIVDVDQAHRLFDNLVELGAKPSLVIVEDGGHSPHIEEGGIAQFFDERLLS